MNHHESGRSERCATEKWWHRLLRVLIFVSTAIVCLISGFWFIVSAEYYTFSYNFEPTYETNAAEELECTYYDALGQISCGDLRSSTDFLSSFLIHKANDTFPTNKNATIGGIVEILREQRFTDDQIVQTLFEGPTPLISIKEIRYREEHHWDHSQIVAGIGYTVGISILWYTFTFLIYKTILYIAHGHTNVRRS